MIHNAKVFSQTYKATSRACCNSPGISVVGARKKLRRVSSVGSQIGRRSLEAAPAAFCLCHAVFVTARISNGWLSVAVRVRSFQVEFEHTKFSNLRFSFGFDMVCS
jgi:hypothetical protein